MLWEIVSKVLLKSKYIKSPHWCSHASHRGTQTGWSIHVQCSWLTSCPLYVWRWVPRGHAHDLSREWDEADWRIAPIFLPTFLESKHNSNLFPVTKWPKVTDTINIYVVISTTIAIVFSWQICIFLIYCGWLTTDTSTIEKYLFLLMIPSFTLTQLGNFSYTLFKNV